MEWNYNDLQKWIKNGCNEETAKKIKSLNINCNNISEIPKEIDQLINLKIFK